MSFVNHYKGPRRQDLTTERKFFEELNDRYHFTMDGASTDDNALCMRHSTAEVPLSWEGERVFCNPPWSDIATFVELAPKAELAVLLVPARVNAKWFHRALALGAVPRYFQGRPKFGGLKSGCPFDCCLLEWSERG